ncbi:unnamed protein product [Trifolium pratense]|uniref:Uncharacterized protein n=1 Tax=Trifolium pratense TaxID=57577 RepID=A0ACB0KGV0_TRIPR|nr:unnamed protein product [Trifolium pratense]
MQKQDVREDEKKSEKKEEKNDQPPLMALNHILLQIYIAYYTSHLLELCRNVKESIDFYTKVLGFVLIERPPVLDFEGAWLFNYGVGIHLVQSKEEDKLPSDTQQRDLDPQDNLISFQRYWAWYADINGRWPDIGWPNGSWRGSDTILEF